jgi:hypothetical protein
MLVFRIFFLPGVTFFSNQCQFLHRIDLKLATKIYIMEIKQCTIYMLIEVFPKNLFKNNNVCLVSLLHAI